MLVLLEWVADEIRLHAESCYPFECGGLLWGSEAQGVRRIEAARPLLNRSQQPQRRVYLHPLDYHASEQQAQAVGLGVWGFYHSHPDQAAKPSPHDLEQAGLIDWSYLIVPVFRGRAGKFQSWNLQEDRESFSEESLDIVTRRSHG